MGWPEWEWGCLIFSLSGGGDQHPFGPENNRFH